MGVAKIDENQMNTANAQDLNGNDAKDSKLIE